MKNIYFNFLFLLTALLTSSVLFANDPCSAISLSNNAIFYTTYDLTGQSPSGIAPPSCGTYNDPDIWFSFTAPTGGTVSIEVKGLTNADPAMAIYSGSCSSPVELACREEQDCGTDPNPGITLDNLTPGSTYYIRVWAEAGGGGTFKIRITDPNANNFTNFYNAYNTSSNCVQLTQAIQQQRGCSWYNISIDFSLPFEMEFTLNFGNIDANGADGICMVYSTAENCGETGGGIGALGIPNSFIITFDTWQNAEYNDPPEDHSNFYFNGDFTNPIVGPNTLGGGNVEDGNDHDVRFTWDPATMTFNVYFDGVLTIGRNGLDIVNQCFGGETNVFWGLTASTGGSVNNQSFCYQSAVIKDTSPKPDTLNPQICDGEQYVSPGGNTYTVTGTYEETYTADNGCESPRTINLTVNALPDKFIDTILCKGTIFDGGSGNQFSSTGTYNYTLNGTPCDTNVTLDLKVLDFNLDLFKTNDLSCYNEEATVGVNITDNSNIPGATYTYTYNWTTDVGFIVSGQGSPNISVDAPGNYTVIVGVNFGGAECYFQSASIYVDVDKAAPTADIKLLQPLDCKNDLGILSGQSSYPLPLGYQWFTNDGNIVGSDIADLISIDKGGRYFLIVQNLINGCSDTAYIDVEREGFQVNSTIIPSAKINCKNDTISINATVIPSDSLTFKWTTTDGHIIGPIDTLTIQADSAGTYVLEITNKEGCTITKSIVIGADRSLPMLDAGMDQIISCSNPQIRITGTITAPNDSFGIYWSVDGDILLGIDTTRLIITSPGTYVMHVVDSTNFCENTDTLVVKADISRPEIKVSPFDSLTCRDSVIQLISSLTNPIAGAIYQWKTGNGNIIGATNTPQINVNQAGTYTLVVTNPSNNCKDSIKLNLTGSTDWPTADAGSDKLLDCNLTSLQLNGAYQSDDSPGDIQIKWTTVGGTIASPDDQLNIDITAPGLYILSITNKLNNCSATDTVQINQQNDKPVIQIQTPLEITCARDSVILIPSWTNAGLNPMTQWSTLDGNIRTPNDSIITVDQGGTYTFLIQNLTSGCTSVANIKVNMDTTAPVFNIPIPNEITCSVKQINVNVNITNGADYTYSWSTSGGNILSGLTTPTILVDQTGLYTVTVTSNSNGCTAVNTAQVKSSAEILQIDAGSDKNLDCITKQADLSVSVNNEPTNLQFQWGTSNGQIPGTGASRTISVNQPGTYIVEVLNPVNQCLSLDTVIVTQTITTPSFSGLRSTESDCNDIGGKILFDSIATSRQPFSFSLNGSPATPVNNSFSAFPSGEYTLQVTDANGCTGTAKVTIDKSKGFTVSLPDSITLETGDSYQINPDFSISSDHIVSTQWGNTEFLNCNQCLSPIFTAGTTSLVTLSAEDDNGCTANADIYFKVNKKPPKIYIPNVFTPNHDGVNDKVFVQTDPVTIQLIDEFRIFDRWGAEVYFSSDFAPNDPKIGWDGYFKGKRENPGVFVYFLKCRDIYGDQILLRGDITLIK